MPETKSPPPRAKRAKTPAQKPKEKPECHIHDKVQSWDVKDIRKNVCVNNEDFTEYEGKYYCFFHLPFKEKDAVKFVEILKERFIKIGNDNSKSDSNAAYDFRYVWFPAEIGFQAGDFDLPVYFDSAIFADFVSFEDKKFQEITSFRKTKFLSDVVFDKSEFWNLANFGEAEFTKTISFVGCKFKSKTYFESTIFSDFDFFNAEFGAEMKFNSAIFKSTANFRSRVFSYADFSKAIFMKSVNFGSTEFTKFVDFSEATFTSTVNFKLATFVVADFSEAIFEEKSYIFFKEAKFLGKLNFNYTNFKGYIAFEGKQDNRLFNGENALLDLQSARIDDAKKISFHSVRLEPSWFINTDASEFVFTDCKWQYADGRRLDVKAELRHLKVREFENPNALLTKACWQLAENYEESKSFPEASVFRLMAFESERLDKIAKRKNWFESLLKIFQEQVLCREILRKLKVTGEKLWKLLKAFPVDFVHSIYYWLSGFGERWFRAFFWLLIIWFGFALIYWFVQGFEGNIQIGGWDSLGYSLQVMTLQRPEPRPTGFTRVIYGIETILAPLQAALLALAIRRKFMR